MVGGAFPTTDCATRHGIPQVFFQQTQLDESGLDIGRFRADDEHKQLSE